MGRGIEGTVAWACSWCTKSLRMGSSGREVGRRAGEAETGSQLFNTRDVPRRIDGISLVEVH
jgi:hypothetical protein